MHFFHRVAGLFIAALCLCACQSGTLDIGQAIINPQEFSIQSLDTISVRVSTVLAPDSFVTSPLLLNASTDTYQDTSMLVGRWTDSRTGTLITRGYTNVDYAGNPFISTTNITVDSLVLELGYAYAYGDTTTAFGIEVHQLQNPLSRSRAYYNTSSAAYDSKPLFSRTVIPAPGVPPRVPRQIRFRMSSAMAQSFYAALADGTIIDNITMDDFWKGFAFVTPTSGNTLIGFSTRGFSGLRLYYHTTDIGTDITVNAASIRFPFRGTNFTQFINDRTGTPLAALQSKTDAVSSSLTNRTSFIAMGLRTRIDFPYISQFEIPAGYAGLNSAQLVMQPVRQTLRDNLTPPNLAIFLGNAQNELLSPVPFGASGALPQSGYNAAGYAYDATQPDLIDNYTFDVTQYASNLILGRVPNRPLILTTLGTDLRTMAQRVTVGDQQQPISDRIQLRLFLTSGL